MKKNAEVEDGVYVKPGLKEYHRGEALFLRAYAYYVLWNVFGTAPLVTERVDELGDTRPPTDRYTTIGSGHHRFYRGSYAAS